MIITIKSKNQKLLDILMKNPESDDGIYLKSLKQGVIIGTVVNDSEYTAIFTEKKRGESFAVNSSDHIDYQNLSAPQISLGICSGLFGHLLKQDKIDTKISWLGKSIREIDVEECTIEVPIFYINSTWIKEEKFLLERYFPELKVKKLSPTLFELTIVAENVFKAINILAITSLFTFLSNRVSLDLFIDNDFVEKYGNVLENIENVPYFVFYLFSLKVLKTPKQFSLIKNNFESYLLKSGLNCDLKYGGTQENRISVITPLLDKDIPTLDIGCGKGVYFRRLGGTQDYFGLDTDSSIQNYLQKRYSRDPNFKVITNISEVPKDRELNILLTEVIEHNTIEEVEDLFAKLKELNFKKIIVSTPNKDFNRYYNIELRHSDHKFEFSESEFRDFLEKVFPEYKKEYFGCGDEINNEQPTQGCIIWKK